MRAFRISSFIYLTVVFALFGMPYFPIASSVNAAPGREVRQSLTITGMTPNIGECMPRDNIVRLLGAGFTDPGVTFQVQMPGWITAVAVTVIERTPHAVRVQIPQSTWSTGTYKIIARHGHFQTNYTFDVWSAAGQCRPDIQGGSSLTPLTPTEGYSRGDGR